MSSFTLRSPAKINLFLEVVNKRKDGYHNIVTLFERISLCDKVQFKSNTTGRICISCNHPQVPTGSKNLVHKAAMLLKEDFALENGVDIKIDKNIPVAAGLAGGSSNAATALMGLNKIWELSLSKAELIKYAKKIGADVPFFIHNCSWGLGTERGDKIKSVNLDAKLWHILVIPRIKLYAKDIYRGLNLKGMRSQSKKEHSKTALRGSKQRISKKTNVLTKSGDNVSILIHHLRKNDLLSAGKFVVNDLEYSIFRLCPNLMKLKNSIIKYNTIGAALSGSGPAVFGVTDSKRKAEEIKAILKKRFSQVLVVKTF